jgi:hypothetical protein
MQRDPGNVSKWGSVRAIWVLRFGHMHERTGRFPKLTRSGNATSSRDHGKKMWALTRPMIHPIPTVVFDEKRAPWVRSRAASSTTTWRMFPAPVTKNHEKLFRVERPTDRFSLCAGSSSRSGSFLPPLGVPVVRFLVLSLVCKPVLYEVIHYESLYDNGSGTSSGPGSASASVISPVLGFCSGSSSSSGHALLPLAVSTNNGKGTFVNSFFPG